MRQYDPYRNYSSYDPYPKSKNKGLRTFLAVLGITVLVAALIAGIIVTVELNKIDYISKEEMTIPEDLDSVEIEDEGESVTVTSDTEIFTEEDMEDTGTPAEDTEGTVSEDGGLRSADGIKNILLLGTDSRKKSLKSRSDVMIILSINDNNRTLTLSSIMRDTYVSIPGKSKKNKINAANAYGGPALAVKTVEENFGIKIDNVVIVNFYSFMDIVDSLGGVTLDVSEAEMKVMNNYIEEINKQQGLSPDHGKLKKAGKGLKITGRQAMGYVRIRYVGNGDYERTDRQRRVLEQIINKAKTAGVGKLTDLLDKVAGNMSTDMEKSTILSYAANAGKYANYDIKQFRIPIDGTYKGGVYKGAWVLRIDFDKNKQALYDKIFG